MTAKEIREIRFEKSSFGYNIEDVERFRDAVAADYDSFEQEKQSYIAKMKLLAEEVRKYRSDEEALKFALLDAHKDARRVIGEASAKSDEIISLATQQADTIIANAKNDATNLVGEARDEYDRTLGKIRTETEQEKENLKRISQEVSSFKKRLFEIYKSHFEIISALPVLSEGAEISLKKDVSEKSNNDNSIKDKEIEFQSRSDSNISDNSAAPKQVTDRKSDVPLENTANVEKSKLDNRVDTVVSTLSESNATKMDPEKSINANNSNVFLKPPNDKNDTFTTSATNLASDIFKPKSDDVSDYRKKGETYEERHGDLRFGLKK